MNSFLGPREPQWWLRNWFSPPAETLLDASAFLKRALSQTPEPRRAAAAHKGCTSKSIEDAYLSSKGKSILELQDLPEPQIRQLLQAALSVLSGQILIRQDPRKRAVRRIHLLSVRG